MYYTLRKKKKTLGKPRHFELIVSQGVTLSKVWVLAHLPAWSYCSQRNPTAMAEAWKRQIRYMQFRNHSNQWGKVKEISDRVRDDFMLPGAAMRVDEDESLAEDTLKSRVLSVQGRERRWHVLYTIFNGGKSNSETKGL